MVGNAVPFVPTTRQHQQFHHHQQEPPTAHSLQQKQQQQEEEQQEDLAGRRVEGSQAADRGRKERAALGMGTEGEEEGDPEDEQRREEGEGEEEEEESLVAAAVHAQKGATAEDARERQLDRAEGAGPPWGREQVGRGGVRLGGVGKHVGT